MLTGRLPAGRQVVDWVAGRTATADALTLAAVVQLMAGVITSKLAATLLGPTGVGVYALVQAVANVIALCSLGTGEALVREWGRRRDDHPARLAAMLRGAELGALAGLAVASGAAVVLHRWLSVMVFGSQKSELLLLSVSAGIAFGWVTLQVNYLVATRRVGRVGLALALAAASTPVVALVGFRAWGVDGIGFVHLLAMLASLITTGAVAMSEHRDDGPSPRASIGDALAELPSLLRFGVPQVVGTLFTAAMLLIVPLVIGATQGVEAAGFYRAAATIAAGMATLFTFVIIGDYSARIAEAATRHRAFVTVLLRQLRQLAVRGVVVVAVLSLTAPLIVPLLYSGDFGPTIRLLPLILVGQLLGLAALTLNVGVGARFGGGPMMINAIVGGGVTSALVAMTSTLAQVGVAFVGGQLVFLSTCAGSLLLLMRADVKPMDSHVADV